MVAQPSQQTFLSLPRRIREGYWGLSWADQHLFAADCAQRALFVFESRYPFDRRPRQALWVRRRWAREDASWEEWAQAQVSARRAAQRRISLRQCTHAQLGASLAGMASIGTWRAADYAACALGLCAFDSDHWQTERLWQWRRLQQYLHGEIPR